MTEKERGICELLFSADTAPSQNALTSKYVLVNSMRRAGRLVVVNYPPIQFPDFEVTRIPRKAPKPSNLGQVQ